MFVLVSGFTAWNTPLTAQDRVYNPYDTVSNGTVANDRDWLDVDAYVSAVDGSARLERAGESIGDFEQVPLEPGDELRTTRGRVEVLFSDGSTIALDEYTDITIDDGAAWRLHGGRLKVTWRAGAFDVDSSPAGVARLRSGGEYRITLAESRRGERELELAVTRGSADLENAIGRTQVRAGTRALTTASYAPSVPYAFAAPRDAFERWTESLAADRYGVESARYLPVELRSYGGEFDRHGYWSHHHSHGWVWYPRVSLGWEPYRTGRWTFIVNFGYSWVGASRWHWPTHHYGRWDRAGDRWFWVPSRPTITRRVGFAVPRHSYSAPVTYYRPVQRVQQGQRVQQVPPVRQVPNQSNQSNQLNRSNLPTPRAIPRDSQVQRVPQVQRAPQVPPVRQVPQVRQGPEARELPGSRTPTRSTPTVRQPETETRPPAFGGSRQAQPRSREPETVRPAAPERSRPTESVRPSEPSRPPRSEPSRPATSQRERSAPPATREAPPQRSAPPSAGSRSSSGSRTPSSSGRSSTGSGGGGTAARRGGGSPM